MRSSSGVLYKKSIDIVNEKTDPSLRINYRPCDGVDFNQLDIDPNEKKQLIFPAIIKSSDIDYAIENNSLKNSKIDKSNKGSVLNEIDNNIVLKKVRDPTASRQTYKTTITDLTVEQSTYISKKPIEIKVSNNYDDTYEPGLKTSKQDYDEAGNHIKSQSNKPNLKNVLEYAHNSDSQNQLESPKNNTKTTAIQRVIPPNTNQNTLQQKYNPTNKFNTHALKSRNAIENELNPDNFYESNVSRRVPPNNKLAYEYQNFNKDLNDLAQTNQDLPRNPSQYNPVFNSNAPHIRIEDSDPSFDDISKIKNQTMANYTSEKDLKPNERSTLNLINMLGKDINNNPSKKNIFTTEQNFDMTKGTMVESYFNVVDSSKYIIPSHREPEVFDVEQDNSKYTFNEYDPKNYYKNDSLYTFKNQNAINDNDRNQKQIVNEEGNIIHGGIAKNNPPSYQNNSSEAESLKNYTNQNVKHIMKDLDGQMKYMKGLNDLENNRVHYKEPEQHPEMYQNNNPQKNDEETPNQYDVNIFINNYRKIKIIVLIIIVIKESATRLN